MNKLRLQLGLMQKTPCPYLPFQEARNAIVIDEDFHTPDGYDVLIQSGYRRTGNNIYRPYCDTCQACHSLRINMLDFHPSKSQKKHLKQLKNLNVLFKSNLDDNWFSLYERYISQRHNTGSMYPANKDEFIDFTHSQWQNVTFMHVYENNILIAIAVTDIVPSGLSALYTFFEPEHHYSLGSLCILSQIKKAKKLDLPWVYLGYQIDNCQGMNYKTKFKPNERFINGEWIS